MTENDRSLVTVLSQLFPELSPTEGRVAILNSIMGLSTKEIARDRGVEVVSVETHFRRAKLKLKCESLQDLRGVITLRILSHYFISSKSDLLKGNFD